MKKRIVCGSAALVMIGVIVSVVTDAEPSMERPTAVSALAARAKADAATIERGRYLIKTTGCNDCHTPGYSLNAGQLQESEWMTGDSLGWQGPWGTTYPTNVRLFVQAMTEEQWLLLARSPARPPMPWFALNAMTDADLAAMFHYLRSLGPAGTPAPSFVAPGEPVTTPVVRFPG